MEESRLDELRRELQPALERLDRGEGIVVKQEDIRAYLEELFAKATAEPNAQSRPAPAKRRLVDD